LIFIKKIAIFINPAVSHLQENGGTKMEFSAPKWLW